MKLLYYNKLETDLYDKIKHGVNNNCLNTTFACLLFNTSELAIALQCTTESKTVYELGIQFNGHLKTFLSCIKDQNSCINSELFQSARGLGVLNLLSLFGIQKLEDN